MAAPELRGQRPETQSYAASVEAANKDIGRIKDLLASLNDIGAHQTEEMEHRLEKIVGSVEAHQAGQALAANNDAIPEHISPALKVLLEEAERTLRSELGGTMSSHERSPHESLQKTSERLSNLEQIELGRAEDILKALYEKLSESKNSAEQKRALEDRLDALEERLILEGPYAIEEDLNRIEQEMTVSSQENTPQGHEGESAREFFEQTADILRFIRVMKGALPIPMDHQGSWDTWESIAQNILDNKGSISPTPAQRTQVQEGFAYFEKIYKDYQDAMRDAEPNSSVEKQPKFAQTLTGFPEVRREDALRAQHDEARNNFARAAENANAEPQKNPALNATQAGIPAPENTRVVRITPENHPVTRNAEAVFPRPEKAASPAPEQAEAQTFPGDDERTIETVRDPLAVQDDMPALRPPAMEKTQREIPTTKAKELLAYLTNSGLPNPSKADMIRNRIKEWYGVNIDPGTNLAYGRSSEKKDEMNDIAGSDYQRLKAMLQTVSVSTAQRRPKKGFFKKLGWFFS